MKKFSKAFLSLLVCALSAMPVFAENFYINNYDVLLNVDKNKNVQVTERIDAYFTNSSHGLIRSIPLMGDKISDVAVSERFTTYKEGDNFNIRIGDPNVYVKGSRTYNIKFNQQIRDGKNEFYYNIIGTGWEVPIHNVAFTINMPEDFNPHAAGLSIGQYGVKGFNNTAVFTVNGKKITGRTTVKLNPHDGVTLRIALPAGYFKDTLVPIKTAVILLVLLFSATAYGIWFRYGKDNTIIPVVSFYPPKNRNSAEAEVSFKGAPTEEGIVSLIVYLANKGYLKIYDGNEDFTLTKIKNYDGKNTSERALMKALFSKKDVVTGRELAVSKTFYKDCQEIQDGLHALRDKIFEKESLSLPLNCYMFACCAVLLILLVYSFVNFDITRLFSPAVIFLLPFIVIAGVIFVKCDKRKPASYIFPVTFGAIPFLMLAGQVGAEITANNRAQVIIAAIGLIIAGICYYQLPKRNTQGQLELGQLLGFKKFLETAEKHRIEMLAKKDPSYCFDVLAYAYVLGVSDAWISKLEAISYKNPDWYQGRHFDSHSFKSFAYSMSNVSVPSTQNGGITQSSSSGGGGFSGGGHGGGGGSSW